MCSASRKFFPSHSLSANLSSAWNVFEEARVFGKGSLLATRQDSYLHILYFQKGKGGVKEDP